jgi:outer membrane protein assembly factor BamB
MFNPPERSQRTTFFAFLLPACLLLSGLGSAAPTITLSKKSGPPTSQILVSGAGFGSDVGVDIFFGTQDKALVVTNGKGEFHDQPIYAPRSAQPGEHWITALERNNDKGAQEQFLVQTDWRQFHFEADGTRLNRYENVLNPKTVGDLQLRWTFSTGFSGLASSAAVVDGVVYIGGYYSWTFYALNAYTGAPLWGYDTDGLVISSPAVEKGLVYFGSGSNNVYASRADTGAVVWIHAANGPVYPSPVVVDGSVFMGSYDQQNIFALNASTGALLWSVTADGPVYSSPAVANGVVYIGSEYPGTSLFALNAKTGASLWTYTLGESGMDSSPAISNGVVYVSAGNLYALDASTGALLWSYAIGGTVSSPAVADGVVYVGGNSIYALDANTGALRWSYAIQGGVLSSPAVANGVVYVGGYDYNVYALDARTGAKLWSYRTNNAIYSSPTVANGMVYTGSDDGNVYAFGLPRASGAKQATAPKRSDPKTLRPDFRLKPSARR